MKMTGVYWDPDHLLGETSPTLAPQSPQLLLWQLTPERVQPLKVSPLMVLW